MIVTDKKYHMEDFMINLFDFCIKRQQKNFDHLFLVDGDEGYGKSTAVVGWANYIAWKTGKPFTVDNVFFDVDKMLEFARHNERQVIVYDEAALGAMASDWQNKTQKKLVKMLMVARKKGHFWFFVIPKFFKLNEYMVVDRARGLFHVYSADDLTRGSFVYFKRQSLVNMYYLIKKQKVRNYKKYDKIGKYVQKGFVIDEDEYERRKDDAIESIYKTDDSIDLKAMQIKQLRYIVSLLLKETESKLQAHRFVGDIIGMELKSMYKWGKLIDKFPEIGQPLNGRK